MKVRIPSELPQLFKLVGLILWFGGLFSWHCMGPLIRSEEHQNSQEYLCVIADRVHHVMIRVCPSGDEYFRQDIATCYASRIAPKWFKKHDRNFYLLSWPEQSLDLIPIETGGMRSSEASGSCI
ncbi:hypothetical protein TNCV_3148851 [Trichonephila clavipes]|nr:hypothetical protein TNCV_3148851 [Trichonephila clavipes]